MKTFKDIKNFERRIKSGPNWADYFTLGGRMYKLYEYGPGPGIAGNDYVYFVNKRTHDAIKVEYNCPSYQYVNGERVQTKRYTLHNVEFLPDMWLWRSDTL
jgi:hypothetical protein